MQQSTWGRGLGLGLLMLLVAGCEDPPLPTTVPVASTSASPSPSPSGSVAPSTAPSTAVASPTPTPLVTPTPTPTPVATATPTPTPTTSTSSSAGSDKTPTSVTFDQPAPTADFTANSLAVRVVVEVPTDVTLQSIKLYYDGTLLTTQLGSGLTLTTPWTPNQLVVNGETTKVVAGTHKLTAVATTTGGSTRTTDYIFEKPFAFKGWTNAYKTGFTFPPLPQARGQVRLVGDDAENQLYAIFGVGSDGADMVNVARLSVDNLGQPGSLGQWTACSPSILKPRHTAATAFAVNYLYVVGGTVATTTTTPNDTGTGTTTTTVNAPTTSVVAYRVQSEVGTEAPPLPVALTDAQAVALDGYLYVCGGSTTGADAGTVGSLYRLKLDDLGAPVTGATWEAKASVEGRRGGALVALSGKLYLLGGRTATGVYGRAIMPYTPSTDKWEEVGLSLPLGVFRPSAVSVGGQILVTGGYTNPEAGKLDKSPSTVMISPTARTVIAQSGLFTAGRAAMGAAVIDNLVYLAGGFETGLNEDDEAIDKPLAEVLRSDAL